MDPLVVPGDVALGVTTSQRQRPQLSDVRFGPKAHLCDAAKGSVVDSIIIFNGGKDRVRLVACRYATTYVRKSMRAAKKMPWSLGENPTRAMLAAICQ